MTRYPRHARTQLTRYRRVERRHPFPKDGTPVVSWREAENGRIACTTPTGRVRYYPHRDITWALL